MKVPGDTNDGDALKSEVRIVPDLEIVEEDSHLDSDEDSDDSLSSIPVSGRNRLEDGSVPFPLRDLELFTPTQIRELERRLPNLALLSFYSIGFVVACGYYLVVLFCVRYGSMPSSTLAFATVLNYLMMGGIPILWGFAIARTLAVARDRKNVV